MGLRDSLEAFRDHGVAVVGVSFDRPDDNAGFARENDFPFPLLSDRDRSLALAVGAADTAEQPFARRISYLVGADGRVLRAYPAVDPQTHATEVLEDLATLARARSAPATSGTPVTPTPATAR